MQSPGKVQRWVAHAGIAPVDHAGELSALPEDVRRPEIPVDQGRFERAVPGREELPVHLFRSPALVGVEQRRALPAAPLGEPALALQPAPRVEALNAELEGTVPRKAVQ